jgi:hypothetical protein
MKFWGKTMRRNLLKKEIILGIIIILTSTSLMPVLSGSNTQPASDQTIGVTPQLTPEKTATVTFYVFEKTKVIKQTSIVSTKDALRINAQLQDLKKELAAHPYDERTKSLVQHLITLLTEKHALPTGISSQDLSALLEPPKAFMHRFGNGILPFQTTSSQWFCNFATTGSGSAFPIIILPRLIPFLLTPIPRIFVKWSTPDGITSVGGLRSGKGFIAGGQQKGLALGFWGIGFSIFLPPISQYGIFGYALFARVSADSMEFWPPNNPPEITQVDPTDGEQMVPVTTSELRFSISDADGDPMSYTVTTDPDIGSGSRGLKQDGVYSIPVHGLEGLTNYTWHISVTDGKDTTDKFCSFTTSPVAPVISNSVPTDKQRAVPLSLSKLQFTIKDYQGDLMSYTVETSPSIGSGSGTNVHNGTYSIPVSGLTDATMYRWFVNVTDGQYWTMMMYRFETPYPDVFDPFTYGWHYRKQITVNHTNVPEDFIDFPVLVHITDSDLKEKAQLSGDDILFMSDTGVAPRLHYEMESYNSATGTLVAWVNISLFSSTQDTVFYMYYSYANCLSQQDPPATWDRYYTGVWHMTDATYTTITDSTAGKHTGTKGSIGHPIETTNGKIGKAQNFVQNSEITIPDSDDFTMNDGTHDVPFTLELWLYPTAINNDHILLAKDGQNRREWVLEYYGYGNYPRFFNFIVFDNTGGQFDCIQGKYYYEFQPNTWYQFTATYDASGTPAGLTLYINGVPITWSSVTNNGYAMTQNTNVPLFMGKYDWPDAKYTYGIMDEMRISKGIARDAAWIATSYQNQDSPAGFVLIGPEETGP